MSDKLQFVAGDVRDPAASSASSLTSQRERVNLRTPAAFTGFSEGLLGQPFEGWLKRRHSCEGRFSVLLVFALAAKADQVRPLKRIDKLKFVGHF